MNKWSQSKMGKNNNLELNFFIVIRTLVSIIDIRPILFQFCGPNRLAQVPDKKLGH